MGMLLSSNSQLLSQWDFQKNQEIDLKTITLGSNKKVWWKCSKGHSWITSVNARKNGKNGCPYCGNQRTLSGYNDLATTNPDALTEWDYRKNAFLPSDVQAGSEKKAGWICPKGHS